MTASRLGVQRVAPQPEGAQLGAEGQALQQHKACCSQLLASPSADMWLAAKAGTLTMGLPCRSQHCTSQQQTMQQQQDS